MSSQDSSATTVEEVWERLQLAITSTIGEMRMKRWFQNVTPLGLNDDVLQLEVPSRTALDWIENNYGEILCREARQAGLESIQLIPQRRSSRESSEKLGSGSGTIHRRPSGRATAAGVRELEFVPDPANSTDLAIQLTTSGPNIYSSVVRGGPAGLRKDLTLERFVVGTSNQVAYSAALEILRTPGLSLNPLFLHGGSGLGKTHLLQAITKKFFIQGEREIRYVQCESFVHQFVRALRQRSLERFRSSFRELKVLVIDDVQMIAGKTSSQQELLETVDAIAVRGGQVLLASDAPPKKLMHLHRQLQNRFSAGLVARVDPPDMETRVSILKQEVLRSGVQVPSEVLRHIADTVRLSVRELLGALVRVVAECELSGSEVTMLRTRAILEPISAVSKRRIVVEDIVERVAVRWGVPPEEILSRSRTRNTSMARSVATYLARVLTDYSLAEIGEQLGGRSHATTSSSYRKIQRLISRDDSLRQEVERLVRDLRGG
ncbi:MAG: chromosomal replication initiator protein DnaA [Planctomycetota bacterium]